MVKRTIDSRIMESIKKYIEKISQYYKIEAIILFGSYAKGTANENSDLDLIVDTSGTQFTSLMRLGALYVELEEAFQKPIDLITLKSLVQPVQMPSEAAFRQQVAKERVCLYAVA